jgi:hypothetical protein
MSRIPLLLPAIALAAFACGGDPDLSSPTEAGDDPAASAVASIELEGAVVMLWDRGVSTQLAATAMDSRGQVIQGVVFEWSSRDPTVATVVDGEVRAAGDGWTVITASAGGTSESVSIVVATPDGPKDRTDCIACHADAYLGQHGGSSTPETCLQCHTGPAWTGGDFDHTAVSNGFELSASHDGYRRLPGKPVHSRTFRWKSQGELIVEDEVTSRSDSNCISRLHLHPDCQIVSVEGLRARVHHPQGEYAIEWSGEGRLGVENSLYCPEFGVAVENQSLAFSSGPGRSSFRIAPVRKSSGETE